MKNFFSLSVSSDAALVLNDLHLKWTWHRKDQNPKAIFVKSQYSHSCEFPYTIYRKHAPLPFHFHRIKYLHIANSFPTFSNLFPFTFHKFFYTKFYSLLLNNIRHCRLVNNFNSFWNLQNHPNNHLLLSSILKHHFLS